MAPQSQDRRDDCGSGRGHDDAACTAKGPPHWRQQEGPGDQTGTDVPADSSGPSSARGSVRGFRVRAGGSFFSFVSAGHAVLSRISSRRDPTRRSVHRRAASWSQPRLRCSHAHTALSGGPGRIDWPRRNIRAKIDESFRARVRLRRSDWVQQPCDRLERLRTILPKAAASKPTAADQPASGWDRYAASRSVRAVISRRDTQMPISATRTAIRQATATEMPN